MVEDARPKFIEKAKPVVSKAGKYSHTLEHPIYVAVIGWEVIESHGFVAILFIVHLLVNIGIIFYKEDNG